MTSENTANIDQVTTQDRIRLIIMILVVIGAFIGFFAVSPGDINRVPAMVTLYHWQFFELGRDLDDFKKENGKMPDAEKWCDVLSESSESSWYLQGPKEEKSSCRMALNENILNLKGDIPGDMIVAFQSKPGWNQTGGLELIETTTDRFAALLGDGNVKVFRIKDAPFLRWKLEDSGVIPDREPLLPLKYLTTAIFLLGFAIIGCFYKYLAKYFLLALLIAVFSAGIAGFLGEAAQFLYLIKDGAPQYGPLYGLLVGFLIALCYISILGRLVENARNKCQVFTRTMLSSVITGVICSSIVHAALMIAYDETTFTNMQIGAGFGVVAGVLLGIISAFSIIYFYRKKCDAEIDG